MVNILLWCLETVETWMGSNRLQLNPGKKERLWIGGLSASGNLSSLALDEVELLQTDPMHNQVVLMVPPPKVVAMSSRIFVQLYVMCQLYSFLDREVFNSIVHALVIFCLDYCNALYTGLLSKSIWQFQLVQNAAT